MRVYDEGEKGDLLLVHPKTHGDTWRLGFECMRCLIKYSNFFFFVSLPINLQSVPPLHLGPPPFYGVFGVTKKIY